MAKFRKGEFIEKFRGIGYSTREIAEILYSDGSEVGQSKVRAMCSYLKKKGPSKPVDPFASPYAQNMVEVWRAVRQFNINDRESIRNTIPILKKSKTMAAGLLWTRRFPVRMIGVLLYGEDSEQSQRRVWAHISKFKKILMMLRRLRMMKDASRGLIYA